MIDFLPRAASPEDAGISSQGLIDFIDAAKAKGLEFHSLLLISKGKIACEMAWAPYDAVTPHTLFSLSKSFASCAAGFAVAEGLLRYEDSVMDILKDKLPEKPHPLLRKVTLHSLLCMGSGLDPLSDSGPRRKADWAKDILSYPVLHEPGTHFHYNTMGTYLVSCMVQKVTGQTCRDYLMPRLFDKLGIKKPQWDCCPLGVNLGGFGLHLSCEDIAKFGLLLLNDGVWEGEQLLPKGWVKLATAKHNENYVSNDKSDWEQGYGYQFWRTRGERYRGDGMFGQVCMVDPARELVIAVTAGIPDMGAQMDLIHEVLVPAADKAPSNEKTRLALQKRLKNLGYSLPKDDGSGADPTGSYMAKGGRMLSLALQNNGDITALIWKQGRRYEPMGFTLGHGKPHRGETLVFTSGEGPQAYLGEYAWHEGVLHLSARMPGGPYTWLCEARPQGEGLKIAVRGAGSDADSYVYTKQIG